MSIAWGPALTAALCAQRSWTSCAYYPFRVKRARCKTDEGRFQLNETSVSQCDPVEISWDTSATPPVRILGVIPQGQVFEFSSVGEANSLSQCFRRTCYP